MIHIFIGTKAQFIKMYPILVELEEMGMSYNLIDSGQHRKLINKVAGNFGIRKPDTSLVLESKNIDTLGGAILWFIKELLLILLRPKYVYSTVFKNQMGICLIHGDTLTTLLSLIYAKRCGIRVVHVESGYRSFDLLNPFPEELIRLIVIRFSDFLFAPSPTAYANLKHMGYKSKSINIGTNTVADTIRIIANRSRVVEYDNPYVLVTLHRVEALYSQKRLAFLVSCIEKISKTYKVVFVLHSPTKQKLISKGYMVRLRLNESIDLVPLKPYAEFLSLISNSSFVITDGGSIQEECFYLGIPCLIMRFKTERDEGLGQNAYLSEFESERVNYFINNLPKFRKKTKKSRINASRKIVKETIKIHKNLVD